MTTPDPERTFRRAVVAAILVLSLLKMLSHEPWRDEWGPWGVAIASDSFGDFLWNQRYGGHPVLWQVLVLGLQRVFGAFVAVQLFQVLVTTATAYVVARWAPFPRTLRALLLLGYFPFFEYGTIVRPYCLALLATCAACAVWTARPKNPLFLAAALAVLVNTTAYGFFVALGIGAAWLVDWFLAGRRGAERAGLVPTIAASLAVAGAVVLALVHMIPPADTGFAAEWHFRPDLARAADALGVVARGLVPVPVPGPHFWNSSVVDLLGAGRAILAAALFAGIAVLFRRRPAALVLWTTASAAVIAFSYAKYPGFLRHHGHVFMAFVAATWIAAAADARAGDAAAGRARRAFLAAVLALHAAAGLAAAGADLVMTFSALRDTARYLRRSGLARLPMVGDRDYQACAVAMELGKPMYFPASGRTSTFMLWDTKRRPNGVPDSAVLAAAAEIGSGASSDVVLVLTRKLAAPPDGVTLAKHIPAGVVATERFWIYVDRRASR